MSNFLSGRLVQDILFGLLLLLLSIQGSYALAGLILLGRSRKRETR